MIRNIIMKNCKYHWNENRKNHLLEIFKSYLNVSEDIQSLLLGAHLLSQRWFRYLVYFSWQTRRSLEEGTNMKVEKSEKTLRQDILKTNSDHAQVGCGSGGRYCKRYCGAIPDHLCRPVQLLEISGVHGSQLHLLGITLGDRELPCPRLYHFLRIHLWPVIGWFGNTKILNWDNIEGLSEL